MPDKELWLTPLILLPGVALLIVSTSARFGQIHAEFHHLLGQSDEHARTIGRHLMRRAAFFRDALVALYTSVVLFAVGSLLGGLINLWSPQLLWITGGLTLAGIVAVAIAAVQLLRESVLSCQVLRDHEESLGGE
jgi:hypothetical protein